jgi:hypothetical protein
MPNHMGLRGRREPKGGRKVEQRPAPPARPIVASETVFKTPAGVRMVERLELETVWYPHRDAASLVGAAASANSGGAASRGRLVGAHAKSQPWSWQG